MERAATIRVLRKTGIGLLLGAVCAAPPVLAQRSSAPAAPDFAFATVAQGQAILEARDDYVRATAPLERSAKLRTAEPVDEERFIRHMRNAPMEWTEEQRKNLTPLIEALSRLLQGVRWKMPARILLVQSNESLEDDLPHTRDNAILVPASAYQRGPGFMAYVLSHESFHVVTRHNAELREALYAAIGFRRCESVVIPPEIAKLRITNPDTIENRHTISVRYRGQPVEALPYVRFASENIDPRDGFKNALQVAWLLVDRQGAECRARGGAEGSVQPQDLDGLYEQVGRNTNYLFHPEEILADNFVHLFLASVRGSTQGVKSPDILEKIRKILFE
jgi:hypothetical protein